MSVPISVFCFPHFSFSPGNRFARWPSTIFPPRSTMHGRVHFCFPRGVRSGTSNPPNWMETKSPPQVLCGANPRARSVPRRRGPARLFSVLSLMVVGPWSCYASQLLAPPPLSRASRFVERMPTSGRRLKSGSGRRLPRDGAPGEFTALVAGSAPDQDALLAARDDGAERNVGRSDGGMEADPGRPGHRAVTQVRRN